MRRVGERTHLFLCFFLLYALSASGDLIGDSEIRWKIAERFVESGWGDLPPGTTRLFAVGMDGRPYSFYGPGQSACLVPFVLAVWSIGVLLLLSLVYQPFLALRRQNG